MKTLNESELARVSGGAPSAETSLVYDIFWGIGATLGLGWSLINATPPQGWYRGFDGSVS